MLKFLQSLKLLHTLLRSPHRHDHIIPFALAHEDMFSEKEIICVYRASRTWFPNIVQVDPAAFDVFTRLSFGRTQAGVHQQLDQRFTSPLALAPADFFGGTLPPLFIKAHLRISA